MTVTNVRTESPSGNKPLLETLAAIKDHRGFCPLGTVDTFHASDRVGPILANASSILSMLAAAAEDADTLVSKGLTSEFIQRNPRLLAGAIEGAGDLIGLATILISEGAD